MDNKRAYKYYTKEEDRIISNHISNNMYNIKIAINELAEMLEDRTADSIKQRWYRTLSKQETNKSFMLIGSKNNIINRKNSNCPIIHKKSIWKILLEIFKL